jgi:5-methylcytosine-specific restriction protein B
MSYLQELKKFILVADLQKKGDGTTNEATVFNQIRLKEYSDLKVDVSFGQGKAAAIPWITFLGNEQSTKNGIYPVFLYFKEKKILFLAYGVSESNIPEKKWNSDNLKTLNNYFFEFGLGIPEKYGTSYFYKIYDLNNSTLNSQIDLDLNELIKQYKLLLNDNFKRQIDKKKFEQLLFANDLNLTELKFSEKVTARFISSLLTKPFVICSGLSGSGKTKLAQAFVQWICESNKQYKIVPVGADWTNREPLLGYPNGLIPKDYVMPDSGALQLIIDAKNDESKPYFLILDEMNLSHVERYFADFLSIMESKDCIKLYDGVDRKCNEVIVAKEIYWPKNLFVIGTVNIDETTYMFSPKVLDRANVIEFRITETEMQNYLADVKEINMDMLLVEAKKGNPGIGAAMATDFLKIALEKHPTNSKTTILVNFFKELQKAGAEFGYRSASEINELIGVLELLTKGQDEWDGTLINRENDFIDIAIMQKLLPKLHGSRNKLTPILTALGKLCVASGTNEYLNNDKEFRQAYFEDNKSDNIIYNLSFEKIKRMYHNCNANGFSSYAEA